MIIAKAKYMKGQKHKTRMVFQKTMKLLMIIDFIQRWRNKQ